MIPRILILGAGAVVDQCFLPALQALGLTAGVHVVDALPPAAEQRSRYPDVQFQAADYREFLAGHASGEFQAAVVALPNALHEAAVRLCLDSGMHVLCEKPLTLSSAVCRSLAVEARRAGRVLAVNMVRRQYPTIKLAQMILNRGLLGSLQLFEVEHGSLSGWVSRTLAPFQKQNGGVLADMGVHYLDMAELLVGELSPTYYRDDAEGGVEAELDFELKTASEVRVRIALSRLRSRKNQVRIVGSEGRLEFPVDSLNGCRLVLNGAPPIDLQSARPFAAGDFEPSFPACFAEQVYQFLESTRTGANSLVDGEAAARTISHIEWAYANRAPQTTRSVVRMTPELEPAPSLVTGATGFIGSHLVEQLAARGFPQITAAVRGPQNCATIARMPVELQMLDLLDAGQVRAALRGKRYVFHLAYGRDGLQKTEVTIDGTRNIVEAAIAEGCEAVVILSTMYVFGQPGGTADETAGYRPMGGEYGQSKAKMERWCLDRARTSGTTRIVILNPSCVFGPRGKTYSELPFQLARAGAFCWIEEGRGIVNYTFVDNLVDAILKAAAVPEAHGQRFIINDGSTTWRKFLEPVLPPDAVIPSYTKSELVALHKKLSRGRFRAAARSLVRSEPLRELARATGPGRFAMGRLRRYLPGLVTAPPAGIRVAGAVDQAAVPSDWLADLFGVFDTRFSSEKAHRLLSWEPRISLTEAQEITRKALE